MSDRADVLARIKALRAELDELIDAYVTEQRAADPQSVCIPHGAHRLTLDRGDHCYCRVVERLFGAGAQVATLATPARGPAFARSRDWQEWCAAQRLLILGMREKFGSSKAIREALDNMANLIDVVNFGTEEEAINALDAYGDLGKALVDVVHGAQR